MSDLFYHHVGFEGARDHFPRSLGQTLTGQQLLPHLQRDLGVPEGQRFADSLTASFPEGFNCWGVPSGGRQVFNLLEPGDVVLLIGKIQVSPYPDGYFEYSGKVRIKYPEPLHWASEYVWDGPNWPLMYFFEASDTSLPWPVFLKDTGYKPRWNPQGMFFRVNVKRYGLLPGGSPDAYFQHILQNHP